MHRYFFSFRMWLIFYLASYSFAVLLSTFLFVFFPTPFSFPPWRQSDTFAQDLKETGRPFFFHSVLTFWFVPFLVFGILAAWFGSYLFPPPSPPSLAYNDHLMWILMIFSPPFHCDLTGWFSKSSFPSWLSLASAQPRMP